MGHVWFIVCGWLRLAGVARKEPSANRLWLIRKAVCLLALTCAAMAWSQNVEKALSPGMLIKGHAKHEESCEKCHERFNKAGQTKLCLSCHEGIQNDIKQHSHLHGHLDESACRTCHTDHKGRDASVIVLDKKRFDHARTGLALMGAHKKLTKEKCSACHQPHTKYRDAPTLCNDCHKSDDVHKGNLGKKCEECHNEEKWKEGTFDHGKTKFDLLGKHKEAACKDCHVSEKYKDTPKECYSCHKKIDNDKGHKGRFGRQCEKCHGSEKWKDSTFDHAADTHYRLKGKHEKVECFACHRTALFVPPKTSTKCFSCHEKIDSEKGHKGTLGEKCDTCHNEQGWKKTSFDHDKDTDYPLIGKHGEAKCESCHTTGLKPLPGAVVREKLPTKCANCHKKDDEKNGHKGKFGDKCESCHETFDWKKTIFDHDKDTKYALKGKHREARCTSCHTSELYKEKTSQECISCHRKTDNEKGHKGQLGTRCNECHDETRWTGVKYDHNKSRFPLTGNHVLVECKKCHLTVAFKDAKRACVSCHQKEDVHKLRLGPKCDQCHNTRTWKSWDFDHGKTKYPLIGAHAKVKCETCHNLPVAGRVALPHACLDCHFDQDVHHGGFGGQCERCHDSVSWKRVRR